MHQVVTWPEDVTYSSCCIFVLQVLSLQSVLSINVISLVQETVAAGGVSDAGLRRESVVCGGGSGFGSRRVRSQRRDCQGAAEVRFGVINC